jgi:hypothetical protein
VITNSKGKFLFLLTLLLSVTQSYAQLSSYCNQSLIDKIPAGDTHIIVDSLNFQDAAKYLQVFRDNWKLTKNISYITKAEVQKNLVPGDTYFNLETDAIYIPRAGQTVWFHLALWMPNKKYKQGEKFKLDNQQYIAKIVLATDKAAVTASLGGTTYNLPFDFSGNGHLFNWSPAYLKNYLQQITTNLADHHKIDYTDDKTLMKELLVLKTNTLFVTDDSFHDIGMFTGDGKTIDTTGLFKKYPYAHRYVSPAALSEKIFHDQEPFYYVLVSRSANAKIINIVNGMTGEVIYSRLHNFSYNLKERDFKELAHAIAKSG